MQKAFVGSKLRQLRRERNETQAQMAANLEISAAYVNMLEKNQRSLSVAVLMTLSDNYGIDWKDLVSDTSASLLADLRAATQDPFFITNRPDLDELRAAVDHSPALVEAFLKLYKSHHSTLEKMMRLGSDRMPEELIRSAPETTIHDFFRDNSNYFGDIEKAADQLTREEPCEVDEIQHMLKRRLQKKHGFSVEVKAIEDMGDALRVFDDKKKSIELSEALDYQNRTFQLAHIIFFVEHLNILESITEKAGFLSSRSLDRCRVELANYFAAALLMPYEAFLTRAEETRYDVDRLASTFLVSYEQASQRLTTLQRDGRRGVPFFFLRVDKAGNVTKRFNATSFSIAEHGGACPVWNLHTSFRTPGVILPQVVELPDGKQFLTLSRTTERPVYSMKTQDRRLAISLGCEIKHARKLIYSSALDWSDDENISKIGINCHLCPRHNCAQRAHDPIITELSTNTNRRGETRYES